MAKSAFDEFMRSIGWVQAIIIFVAIGFAVVIFPLNWEWILVRAAIPIFAPTILLWFFFAIRLVVEANPPAGDLRQSIPFRRGLVPSAWMIYTIVATVDSLYELLNRQSTVGVGYIVFFDFLILLAGVVIYYQMAQPDAPTDTEASRHLIVATLILALAAAVVSYLTFV